jgi:pimeloyl-ACP methyl ester carboxylesterase
MAQRLIRSFVLLTALLLTACLTRPTLAQAVLEASGSLLVHEVLPSATDSHIDKFSGNGYEHMAYFNPSAIDRRQLVVFLPGTGGNGHGARAFCSLAANEGFHLVSLSYPSAVSISEFRNSPDPDVFRKAREDIIYGQPPFSRLNTGVPNSIHNRLQRLLSHLSKTFPRESWAGFLNKSGELDYRTLILAGQSQGGGHAALLAKQHQVARVLMFGSPKDFSVYYNQPARWYSDASATPLERFFSFVHSQDEGHGCTYPQQLANYQALKLLPKYSIVNVDDTRPPYGHSRLLTSKRASQSPHTAPIGDQAYEQAWKYLLKEPVP